MNPFQLAQLCLILADREVWSRPKALFLITKYKALMGSFRTKRLMWMKLADIINEQFGGHLMALPVESKRKFLERRYKKTKVKNNSTGHFKVVCDYKNELTEVLAKLHHITPTVLLTQGRIVTAQQAQEQATASKEEMGEERSNEPQAAPHLVGVKKRCRRDTPVKSFLQITIDAEAAREKRPQERMALLWELIGAVRPNKG